MSVPPIPMIPRRTVSLGCAACCAVMIRGSAKPALAARDSFRKLRRDVGFIGEGSGARSRRETGTMELNQARPSYQGCGLPRKFSAEQDRKEQARTTRPLVNLSTADPVGRR